MSKMEENNLKPQLKIKLYEQLSRQKMKYFRFLRIMLIIGTVFSFLSLLGQIKTIFDNSAIYYISLGFTNKQDYITQNVIYTLFTTVPGLIIQALAAYSLFNLKKNAFIFLCLSFCQINFFTSLIFMFIIHQPDPGIIGAGIVYIVYGILNYIYFKKRKEIFTSDLDKIKNTEYPEADNIILLYTELPKRAIWSTYYLLNQYDNTAQDIIINNDVKKLIPDCPQIGIIIDCYNKLPSIKRKCVVNSIKIYNKEKSKEKQGG